MNIIAEVVSLIMALGHQQLEKFGLKVWQIVTGITLALMAVVLFVISIVFFGYSLYQQLAVAADASTAALAVGGFFLLIAIFLLVVSKKIIKKN